MQPRKHPGIRSARLTAAASGIAAVLVGATLASADVDTVWVGRASSLSWTNAANWDQVLVPNGPISVARFNENSGGAIVNLNNASVQLSLIALTDPLFTGITGNGTINLTSAATIFADGGNFDLPEKVYQTFGSYDPAAPRPGNNFSIAFVGSSGLTKLGDSHIQIDANQYYTGGTTIGGGKIISTIGDSAFGDASGSIMLSNGSIQISTTDWFTSRAIVAGAGVGSQTSTAAIYWVGNDRKVDFFGDISGVGTLDLNGFYGTNVGSAVFHANNTFQGTLALSGGTIALRDSGAFNNIGSFQSGTHNGIVNGGTIVLDNSNSTLSINRLQDNTPLTMRGAALTIVGGATPYGENVGSLVMDGGVSYVSVLAGAGGASVSFSNLDRRDLYSSTSGDPIFLGSGLVFRGNNLGAAPGPGVSNIYIGSGTLLLQNGILPFAWGNASYTSATSPESPNNTLMTYDAINGVKPVVSYLPDFTLSNNATNVRVTSSMNVGSTTVNANAIVLAAPSSATFATGQGMTLSGAGTVHVQSGVILSASSGNTGTAGAINSLPGNVISVNLDFGSNLAEIMTPSAITISGAISGTGGLAKIGPRTAVFSGGNTYTGKTYLTGFTRFVGNVWADGFTANPFGLSQTPIVLYGGNATAFNPDTNAASGTGFAQLGSDSPGNTNFNRKLELRGDRVMLRSFGNGTVLWNGDINILDPQTVLTFLSSKSTAHMVVNGSILGSGQVIIGSSDAADPLSPTWVDLMNDATFSGGLVLAGGTIGIGNDNALGHFLEDHGTFQTNVYGTVKVSGNTLMTALGGSRIINNPFIVYGNTLGIGGSNSITLAGSIEGRGGDYVANVTSSVPALISGTLTGGGLVKTGGGTLILTGNNNFTGVMSVGNGTTQGGVLLVKSPTAFGSTVGPTGVDYGPLTATGTLQAGQQNQIILDSTGTVGFDFPDELLYLKGFGVANTGAVRNLVGQNTWNGTVRISPTYRDAGTATAALVSQVAGIGVDAGTSITFSTLRLKNGILADDDTGVKNNLGTTLFLANAIGMRKVGGGALIVGSQPLSSGSNTWNAAINMTGGLEIQAGTVQIASGSGVATIQGGRSVVNVATLNLAGSLPAPVGKLDLMDNALIVNDPSVTTVSAIRQYLRAGYGTGSFNGAGGGIFSSTATSEIYSTGKITLGYAETSVLPITNIFGHAVDSSAIVVKPAYAGDSNLDGKVDVTDLTAVALHWQVPSNSLWTTGDFNYDGAVNISDLLLMGMNWQLGVSNPLVSISFDSLLQAFKLPEVAVPEPVGMSGILLGFTGLLARRRKR